MEKAIKILDESKNKKISKTKLLDIYKKLSNISYRYMNVVYESENISGMNKHEFFSAEESLISHSMILKFGYNEL